MAADTYTLVLTDRQRDALLTALSVYIHDPMWQQELADIERDLSVAAPTRKAA